MRYAIVDSLLQIVVNICLWDGVTPYNPGPGLYLVKIEDGQQCDIGWSYDGTNFIPPAE